MVFFHFSFQSQLKIIRKSSSTCPAPSACRRQSPPTPTCASDRGTAFFRLSAVNPVQAGPIRLTFSSVFPSNVEMEITALGGVMQTRKLGNSDMHITPVGYGAWAVGGSGWDFAWGVQDDNDSIGAIHRSLELGVNWIDTAAVYGLGHSEEVVGRALKDWRGSRPYVFTKCGLRWGFKGEVHKVLSADSIREEVENSLRRLSVDVIDLYQIHWPPDPDSDELEEGWSTLADLKREGKVRWIGVSNFNVQQMRRAQDIAPVTSLQPPYSLVHREIEDEILPYCLRQGIGVIVYSPMASGLLTGAMTRERAASLPKDD